MNSFEKNVRIVCRMKSVDVTRVMPRRCAASVAIVDLPVPVAPPTRSSSGSSSRWSASILRSRRTVRAASSSPMSSDASSPRRSRSSDIAPRSARSRSARRAMRYARSGSSPVTTSARAIRPFENGTSSPSGSGRRWRRSLTSGIWPCGVASRQGPARRAQRTTSFAASTISAPFAIAASATTSIAAAFSSTR